MICILQHLVLRMNKLVVSPNSITQIFYSKFIEQMSVSQSCSENRAGEIQNADIQRVMFLTKCWRDRFHSLDTEE